MKGLRGYWRAQIRVGDIYLAIVLEVCSRRVVGWPMATHLKTDLVVNTLKWRCRSFNRMVSSSIVEWQ